MQNSQNEGKQTPQKSPITKSPSKATLAGISPIRSSKTMNITSQSKNSTIFAMQSQPPAINTYQQQQTLQQPILNKFRRSDAITRGVSNPPSTSSKIGEIQKPPIDPNNNSLTSGSKPSTSTPTRGGSVVNSSLNQSLTKSQSILPPVTTDKVEKVETIYRGDLTNRFEMTDRGTSNVINEDDDLLVTPEKAAFFDNQDSRHSLLSTPNADSSSLLFDRSQDSKTNVKVVIRVRPMNDRELGLGQNKNVISVENQEKIILDRQIEQKTFTFDYVADINVNQQEIFTRIAQPVADSCLLGYNGSIFAYGQTGSGKTFTIQGPTIKVAGDEAIVSAQNSSGAQFELRGLMQRSFEYIFRNIERETLEQQQKGCEVQYLVKASYLEIYNEQIMDLLDPQSINLHVREDIKKGVYVESLQEEAVSSVKDMINLITRGARNRHVGSTIMNKESSRSHSVLTTSIECKILNDQGNWQMKSSRFHIIDLAGSERAKNTNSEGQRLKEAGMINKSLSALGIVINSLVEISEGKNRHVHYRDSKLTFLLRDSLGGNSKTTIIAAISPAQANAGETLSTLKFAQRAKLIKNKAVINEESSSTIHMLKQEIRRLKKELAESAQARMRLQDALANQRTQEYKDLVCVLCKGKLNGEDDEELLVDEQPHMTTGTLAEGEDENLELRKLHSSPGMISGFPGVDDSTLNVSQFATQQVPISSNPKAFKMYRERLEQLKQAQKRIVYLENLLSANLDNLSSQQKYYDLKIEKNKEQTERMQAALETFEKQSSRDKMIIKFREQRIEKLEEKINKDKCQADGDAGCAECKKLLKEVESLKQERDSWKESSERNPMAAKLFVEKAELVLQKAQYEAEAKVSPESLTAQIRGLNELTESLSNYLKEHCETRSKEKEEEFFTVKNQLSEKVAILEQQLDEKTIMAKENELRLTTDFNAQINEYIARVESLKLQHANEKDQAEKNAQEQIEQIKKDLEVASDATQSQETMYKQLKIESIEKQNQLQHKINSLQTSLEDMEEKEARGQSQIAKLNDQVSRLNAEIEAKLREIKEKQDNFEWQLDNERTQAEAKIKALQEENFTEVQTLEKEVIQVHEESDLLNGKLTDTIEQLDKIKKENDLLNSQLIEAQEERSESQRIVKELEHQISQEAEGKKTEIQGLTNQLDEVKIQLEEHRTESQNKQAQLETQVQEARTENESLKAALCEQKVQEESLQSALSEQKHQNDAIQSRLSETTALLTEKTILLQESQATLQSKERELETKELLHKSLEATASKTETMLNEIKTEAAARKQQLTMKEAIQHNLEARIVQAQKELDDKLAAHRQALAEKESQHDETKQQLDLELTKKAEIMAQLSVSEIKHLEKTEEIASLNNKLVHQQTQLQQQRDSLGRSMQTLSQISDQAKSYGAENARLKQQLQEAQTENENLKDQLQAMDEMIVNLTKENQEKQEALIQLQDASAQQLAHLQETSEAQISQLKTANEDGIKQRHQIVAKFESRLKEMAQSHEDALETLKVQSHQERESVLMKQQEEAKAQLEEETSAVQMAIQNHFLQKLQQQEVEVRDRVKAELKAESSMAIEEVVQKKEAKIRALTACLAETKRHNLTRLMQLSQLVQALRREIKTMREQVTKNDFSKLAPSQIMQQWASQLLATSTNQLKQHESSIIEKHATQLLQLESKVKEKQKQFDQQRMLSQQAQQDCLELKEQLTEYKGLVHQLTEEKQQLNEQAHAMQTQLDAHTNQSTNIIESLNTQLMNSQKDLSESHQMLTQQKQLLDDSLKQLNANHIEKYQQQQKLYAENLKSATDETDRCRSQIAKLTNERDKLLQKTSEHKGMLLSNKDTIQSMVNNENQLMTELKKKITELGETQEHWKQKVIETKQEKEQISFKVETLRKENENLRELIKLKDGQIQDGVQTESNFKQDREKLQKENKDLKLFIHNQESQMKEVVRTLKAFSDEKKRLEAEIARLQQSEFNFGHENKHQKVQYHLRLKEEFNILKEENDRLQEELRKRSLDMFERQSNSQGGVARDEQTSNEIIRIKKDQYVILESINSLIESLLMQPGVSAYINDKPQLKDVFTSQLQTQGTMSASSTVTSKLRAVSEVVMHLGRNLSSRIKERNEIDREYKRLEASVVQLQKEKTLLTQQIESSQRQFVPGKEGKSQMASLPQMNKDRYGSGNREQYQQQQMIPTKDSQPLTGGPKMQVNLMQQADSQSRPQLHKTNSRTSINPQSKPKQPPF